ncbi:hypothetical protein GCM10007079_12190 [Nocardiopsis terrae]|uniref:Lysylphosphatidylglycerol synthetase-like protein (DUF2156 family) n=1 Tax=Nocardiopsis terrae TaxID=372655 RepID=A0ABR9HC23_9ACTN|nr:hypothetical protein [Nocardiopsis terrae]MBE1456571.1 lysylphosphatidylglycerol synthetase-like protein (DUF2156 family) [Nocardiopsis terrae]GHC76142.1 hypothetical protein GCM10007079_12190 [Nocardiopsis terrae]
MRLLPGRFLARVTALPAIALSAWLLVAFLLLVLGQFTPLTGAALGLPAVVAACALLPRLVPDPPVDEDVPWWPVIAVLAVTAGFAAVQIAFHAEALVIRRDPASYAMYTSWIAENGYLPIPQQRELIAGDDPGLSYQSLAHYERDNVIWPQFMAGAPLVLAVGYWLGGLDGMLVTAPVLGALGVLTFAGLTARLVGARWAPLAALVLAVCLPQQWVSRFTYSEPLAQVLLLGGLVLAFDALARRRNLTDRWQSPQTLAAVAGVVFGLGVLVRIDAIRDLLPVVGFVGILLVARRGQALPLLAGLCAGLAYGLVAGYGYSYPYLEYLSDSLNPLLLISAGVVFATVVLTAALWRYGLPHTERVRWLPNAMALFTLLVMVGFAVRPLLWPDYGHGSDFTDQWVAYVQGVEGLPIEGSRTYYDMSLYWVGWYVGLGTVLFASLGVALVLRRLTLRRDPYWLLPAMLLVWTVGTTLLRPAITPDHPWASRRLIVLVIPAFILFAVWFLAWLTRYCERAVDAARGGPLARSLPAVLAAGAAVSLLVPAAVTSAWGIMGYRQDVGTVAQTERLCESLPARASVIVVDSGMAGGYMPLLRNVCGVPTAALDDPTPESVERVVSAVHERGRDAVLAAPEWDLLAELTGPPVEPERHFHVVAEMDPSTLMEPPTGHWTFNGSVWTAVLPAPECPPTASCPDPVTSTS